LAQLGKGVVTGKTAEVWNTIGSGVRTILEKAGIPAGNLSDISERNDALRKWYANIVTSTPFAAGSDARMSEVINGNPSMGISQATGEDMLKAGIALQRMRVAAVNQWTGMSPQDRAQNGGNYQTFLNGYSNRVDPRAFGVDMYNDTQKDNLRKALKDHPEDAQRFIDSYNLAQTVLGQRPMPSR
jgi:hypothetical protein